MPGRAASDPSYGIALPQQHRPALAASRDGLEPLEPADPRASSTNRRRAARRGVEGDPRRRVKRQLAAAVPGEDVGRAHPLGVDRLVGGEGQLPGRAPRGRTTCGCGSGRPCGGFQHESATRASDPREAPLLPVSRTPARRASFPPSRRHRVGRRRRACLRGRPRRRRTNPGRDARAAAPRDRRRPRAGAPRSRRRGCSGRRRRGPRATASAAASAMGAQCPARPATARVGVFESAHVMPRASAAFGSKAAEREGESARVRGHADPCRGDEARARARSRRRRGTRRGCCRCSARSG